MSSLLEVKDLKTYFFMPDAVVKAVDGISYEINEGEIVGVVGESGSGKSVSAMSVMRLIASPPGRIVNGEVIFEGDNLVAMNEDEIRKVRGNDIAMIFQEPMTSLNPVLSIGRQITETLELHQNMNQREAREKASELLTMVGIPDADTRLDHYPHQFSGGMRQRVMIAIALSCDPKLIIADEPTTALDVTIQAQILELMKDLSRQSGTALMIITHNLGVVARYADRVIVMYAGKIVETSSAVEIYKNPMHPYTQGLLNSVPRLDSDDASRTRLEAIEGMPPSLSDRPGGCGFQSNCESPSPECSSLEPVLREDSPNHWVLYCSHCEKEHGCKWFPRDI